MDECMYRVVQYVEGWSVVVAIDVDRECGLLKWMMFGFWLGLWWFHVCARMANCCSDCAEWMPSIKTGLGLCGSLMIIFSRKIICPSVREGLVNAWKVILSKYVWYCVGKSFSMLGRKVVGCVGG